MANARRSPDDTIIAKFLDDLSNIDTATIYEAADKKGLLPTEIAPIWPKATVCGRALTVACPAGDNLTLHQAVCLASPGDVLVADTQGFMGGSWGEVLTVAAQAKGIAGLVIYGGVRDIDAIARRGFPVFAIGRSARACTKEKLGFINDRLPMGETVIDPGDLIIGDAEGVVVVPLDQAKQVIDAAHERLKEEEWLINQLQNGRTTLDLLGLKEVIRKLGSS